MRFLSGVKSSKVFFWLPLPVPSFPRRLVSIQGVTGRTCSSLVDLFVFLVSPSAYGFFESVDPLGGKFFMAGFVVLPIWPELPHISVRCFLPPGFPFSIPETPPIRVSKDGRTESGPSR